MSLCFQGQTVMAYATYCQQDELGRPVAGLINYCPARLRASANNRQKIFLVRVIYDDVYEDSNFRIWMPI